MKNRLLELAHRVLDIEADAIRSLKPTLGDDFLAAVDLCAKAQGKVIWTGMGKSGHIARKLASTMSSTGTPAMFLHPAESSHGDLGFLGEGDLVIGVSYAGRTPELHPILTAAARKGIPVIAITANVDSELSQRATITLSVRIKEEACPLGLAPTASTTATLAMGDALAMAVLEAKGFRAEKFAENHPGGHLGFRLLRIENLMHSGESLPILKPDASMKEVFSVMSHGETRGAAGVVNDSDELMGIITDGDLRRLLEREQDPFVGTAEKIMSRNPRTISSQELAEKALFLMEEFRINLLFVVDPFSSKPRKPVGVIHVQDLLRAKIR